MKAYADIFAALEKSVAEVVAARPENLEEELAKRFADAGDALAGQLTEDLPLDPGEADHVTLMVSQVASARDMVDAIEGGACLKVAGCGPAPESLALLKTWVALGELAGHALATELAVPVTQDDQLEEGEELFKVASGEGEVLVKSALPDSVASLIVHPDELQAEAVSLATDLLALAGVGPRDLAKAFPPPKRRGAAASEEDDEGDEEDEDQEDEGEEGDEPDGDEDGYGPGDGDGDEGQEFQPSDNPIDNIAKLGSMILLEVDALNQMTGGDQQGPDNGGMGGDPNDPNGGQPQLSAIDAIGQHAALIVVQAQAIADGLGGDDDQEGDDGQGQEPSRQPPPRNQQGDAARKAAGQDDDLAKTAPNPELEALRKQATDANARVAAAEADAAAARAAADAAMALPKAGGPVLNGAVVELEKSHQQPQELSAVVHGKVITPEALEKMTPTERAVALLKIAHQGGGKPFLNLEK